MGPLAHSILLVVLVMHTWTASATGGRRVARHLPNRGQVQVRVCFRAGGRRASSIDYLLRGLYGQRGTCWGSKPTGWGGGTRHRGRRSSWRRVSLPHTPVGWRAACLLHNRASQAPAGRRAAGGVGRSGGSSPATTSELTMLADWTGGGGRRECRGSGPDLPPPSEDGASGSRQKG